MPVEKNDHAPGPGRKGRGRDVAKNAKKPTRAKKSGSRPKTLSLLRNKSFWQIVAASILLIVLVAPVFIELIDRRPAGSFEELLATGDYYYDRGLTLWDRNDLDGARQSFALAASHYEEALAQRPDDAQVRTDLGTMYFYRSRLNGDLALVHQAIEAWSVALSYRPDSPEALFNLGLGYAELGQVDQALAAWQRVIEVVPGTEIALAAQGLIDQYGEPPLP